MASIRQRGNSWQITVSNGYDGQGKKIIETMTVKNSDNLTPKKWERELERIALEFETKVNKGLYLDNNVTLSEFTERWFREYGNKQLQFKTLNSFKFELDTKILPALGHLKLNKITPVHILSFLNNLLEDGVRRDKRPGGYSNKTVRYQWQILSSIFQQAVYWQILHDNPCKRVKSPKNNEDNSISNEIKHLNEVQTLILLEIVKNEDIKYQIATNIVIFCGVRNGEVLGLTWNDIDFENKTISINKARAYVTGKNMFTKSTKTESSIRTINIPDMLVQQLREYKEWQSNEKAKCGDLWSKEWNSMPWVLTQWDGNGMHYCTLTNWLYKLLNKHNDKIIKDSSIAEQEKSKYLLPIISLHKLRHTSATLLIAQNMDIKTVSKRLGHSQTSTTMNIYVHGLKSGDIKAANALEGLLGTSDAETGDKDNA